MSASGIAAGDVGFTRGLRSFVCWLIRHWSGSSYSHALIFVALHHMEGTVEVWETHEAWPAWRHRRTESGPRTRTRRIDTAVPPHLRRALKVERVARTEQEAANIVAASWDIVNERLPYGCATIVEIGTGLRLPGRGIICSEHVRRAIEAAIPEFGAYLSDLTGRTDPGQLSEACDAFTAYHRGDAGARAAA